MGSTRVRVKKKETGMTDNVINFEEYKKKHKGGFAPVTVEEQREQIELQRQEIEEQRREILKGIE